MTIAKGCVGGNKSKEKERGNREACVEVVCSSIVTRRTTRSC